MVQSPKSKKQATVFNQDLIAVDILADKDGPLSEDDAKDKKTGYSVQRLFKQYQITDFTSPFQSTVY